MNFDEEYVLDFITFFSQKIKNVLLDALESKKQHQLVMNMAMEQTQCLDVEWKELELSTKKCQQFVEEKEERINKLRALEKDKTAELNTLKEEEKKLIAKHEKIDNKLMQLQNLKLKLDFCEAATKAKLTKSASDATGYIKHDDKIECFDVRLQPNTQIVANRLWKTVAKVVHEDE